MMHGRGKSDSAIVAEKLANNAEQPAAEPVEPRAEAEGNANQQSTDRTQRRQDVSQALARIRRVARQRKKDKFTALFHHLSTDLLEQAFSDSVDRLTWNAFRHHVTNLWRRSLQRRSQKDRTIWERIKKLVDDFLPQPRILHPWPKARFAVKHPRWEPSA